MSDHARYLDRPPLSPRGAVASALLRREADPFARVRAFAAEHALSEAELASLELLLDHFTAGSGDEERAALATLLVALQIEVSAGSSALALGLAPDYAELVSWLVSRGAPVDAAGVVRGLARGLERQASSSSAARLCGSSPERRPLVLEDGVVTFHYLGAAESVVAESVARLLEAQRQRAPLPGAAAALRATLADAPLYGRDGQPLALAPEQVRAVLQACCSSLLLLSGGPGTGKTSVITALLRAFAAAGVAPGELVLAAPTGRAAKRMTESVEESLRLLGDGALESDRALAGARVEARTLHRLLGYTRRARFPQRDAGAPLPARLVIIDEVSMVDLPLMAALTTALPRARPFTLVLVGDAEQLPAVGTGDVLRQLTSSAPAASPALRRALTSLLDELGPETSPALAGAIAALPDAEDTSLAASYVRLKRPFRQADTPGGRSVRELAAAMQRAEGAAAPGADATAADVVLERSLVERSVEELDFDGVAFVEATAASAVREALLLRWAELIRPPAAFRRQLHEGFVPGDEASLRALLEKTASARALCFTHKGPAGEEAVNGRLRELLHRAGPAGDYHFPGAPVLVLENDYGAGLFNGDQGVAALVREDTGAPPGEIRLDVAFPSSGGVRRLPSGRLPRAKLCFAMTVHKSQGSEYDHVLVLLPDEGNRLLLRETLYTAVTRARRSVTLVGRRELLVEALARRSFRTSRLRARIERRG